MGWTSPFYSVEEAIKDEVRWISKDWRVIDINKHETYFHLLVEKIATGEKDIIYNIYKKDILAKKEIPFCDPMHIQRAPKKWVKMVYKYQNETCKKWIDDYKNYLKEKKKAPKLDDVLKVGKKYKIFGEYIATFSHKRKRTFLFDLNGKLTKFLGLKVKDVEAVA